MKVLTVDFDLIAQSMRDLAREHDDYYIDLNSGKVIPLSRDLIRALTKEGFEERDPIPEWDACMIPLARKIVLSGSKEFSRIPEAFGRPEHQWRVLFADTVKDADLKHKLVLALRGRGSCKRFCQILNENRVEKDRWNRFYAECWKDKITKWLESIGILAFQNKPGRLKTA